jgi:simple sugar transport system permease protein
MIATILLFSVPLILAAMGEVVGQRAGMIDIGQEGKILIGAFVGFIAAKITGSLIVGYALAVVAGVALGCLSTWFTAKLQLDQVVVGTALNLLALGATSIAFRIYVGDSGKLLSIDKAPALFGLDPVVYLAILSPAVIWFVLMKTSWGLSVRASGEYPPAVEAAGISVIRRRFEAAMLAGGMSGLAGAALSIALSGSLGEGMSAGRGFLAIAVVTFGRWRAPWVAAAALLIGVIDAVQYRFQGQAILGFKPPLQLWQALPYLGALLILFALGRGAGAPAALGRAYNKER